jgi:hypothetical protein
MAQPAAGWQASMCRAAPVVLAGTGGARRGQCCCARVCSGLSQAGDIGAVRTAPPTVLSARSSMMDDSWTSMRRLSSGRFSRVAPTPSLISLGTPLAFSPLPPDPPSKPRWDKPYLRVAGCVVILGASGQLGDRGVAMRPMHSRPQPVSHCSLASTHAALTLAGLFLGVGLGVGLNMARAPASPCPPDTYAAAGKRPCAPAGEAAPLHTQQPLPKTTAPSRWGVGTPAWGPHTILLQRRHLCSRRHRSPTRREHCTCMCSTCTLARARKATTQHLAVTVDLCRSAHRTDEQEMPGLSPRTQVAGRQHLCKRLRMWVFGLGVCAASKHGTPATPGARYNCHHSHAP